jgi:hypothetical protein
MPALVAGIHALKSGNNKDVDGRDEPGHDGEESRSQAALLQRRYHGAQRKI